MSEWTEFSILDIAEIHNQKRIPLSKMQRLERKAPFPYYGASGIIDYIDDFLFDGEFVLISEDGENLKSRKTSVAFRAKGKFWVNNHAHILQGKKPFYNKILIYYFQNLDLNEFLTGAVQPKLNRANLLSIPILLPVNEKEQKAIVSVLTSLDDKIDLLHRQNKTLEAMAETLFREWFVEGEQEDWEDGVLGDISENIKDGIRVEDIDPTLKYVALEHINKKEIGLKKFDYARNVASNKYRFEKKDILFGKLRPYFHKVCFTPFSGICSTDILVIRPKKNELFCFCLFAFFQKEVVDFSNSGATGTRMPRTNWDILRSFELKIPDTNTILKFNEIVEPFIGKIENNISQIRTLESLRDTLLPKLMNGEVKISKNE